MGHHIVLKQGNIDIFSTNNTFHILTLIYLSFNIPPLDFNPIISKTTNTILIYLQI